MITGGIKFFEQNAAWLVNGGSIVDGVGTGSSVVRYLLGKSRYTYWSTVGSTDLITETLIQTFPAKPINRLFAIGHNWKQFDCQYWDGATWVDFTGVRGLDVAIVGGITETAFADSTAYYEVNTVTTDQVRWRITKTKIADQEKTATFLIVTSEIGTLRGFPQISPAMVTRNSRVMNMPSGKRKVIKAAETFDITLGFSPYSSNADYTADLDLMYLLHDRDIPFLMWPCGGRRGVTYFKYPLRHLRLQDIFLAQLMTDIAGQYNENYYRGPVDLGTLEFAEHV